MSSQGRQTDRKQIQTKNNSNTDCLVAAIRFRKK